MAPDWLTAVAWFYLSVCFCCAAIIGYDIVVGHRRQPMGVMNFVYPITALYFGPVGLAFYWRWARAGRRMTTPQMATTRASMSAGRTSPGPMSQGPMSQGSMSQGSMSQGSMSAGSMSAGSTPYGGAAPAAKAADMPDTLERGGGPEPASPPGRSRPRWVMMAIEVSHCGSGCALGDVISEFVVFAAALAIAGLTLGAEYLGDYVFALILGIVFQYFAIAPMRGLGVKDGLIAATKADFISLTAFEVGLFGWMAIMTFVLFPAPHNLLPNSAAFWLLMQVGMMIGFATSWPANVWLIKRGIKVPM